MNTSLRRACRWMLLLLTPAACAPLLCNTLPLLASGSAALSPAWQATTAWDVAALALLIIGWMLHVRCRMRAVMTVALLACVLAILAPAHNVLALDGAHVLLRAPIAFSPRSIDSNAGPLASSSAVHPLGTDHIGRDVAARLLHGLRDSVGLALAAATCALLLGAFAGVTAAVARGWLDMVLTLAAQALSAFPVLLVVLLLQGMALPSIGWLLLLLVLFRVAGVYRLMRGETARLLGRPWMAAARADGLSLWMLLRRELLPHLLAPMAVNFAFGVAAVILVESSLSFLGFGVPAPLPSLGEMLQQGRALLPQWTRLLLLPCVLITGVTVLTLHTGTLLRRAAAEERS